MTDLNDAVLATLRVKHHRWLADTSVAAATGSPLAEPCPPTFEEFCATAMPMIGEPGGVVIRWCGMWLGIEPDGYAHT